MPTADNRPQTLSVKVSVHLIERNNPDVDVDLLVVRIQEEVLRREAEGDSAPIRADFARPPQIQSIRTLLATAEKKAEVRAQWSGKLIFFPFNLAPVQRFLLRALAYLFKDQRHVNLSLVQAMRELVEANEALEQRVAHLEERLNAPATYE